MVSSLNVFPPGEHWYCVRSKPKKERLAAMNLNSMYGLDVFCPQVRFRRKTVRGAVWFQEAMFPGYVFVRFDMFEMKRAVASAVGVMNIPYFNGRYIPVPESVIEGIRKELDEMDSEDREPAFKAGDEASILDGAMCGLKVKVVRLMPAKERVAVLLDMMGTLVETELPLRALEPVASAE